MKLIVYTPEEAQGRILALLREAGAGAMGAYRGWSVAGVVTERFTPLEDAQPYRGQPGEPAEVATIRLEFQVPKADYPKLIEQIKKIHPYETPAIEVLPLLHPEG